MNVGRSTLTAVSLALVACSASPPLGDAPHVASASAAPSASASAAPRTPMTIDEAMASFRAARASAEKREGRPSRNEFKDAGADLRAAGVDGKVAVVRAMGRPEALNARTGVVSVWAGDQGALVFEIGEGTSPRLFARKIVGRSEDFSQIHRLGESFVLQRSGVAALFTSVDAAPIQVESTNVRVSQQGWFGFFKGDEVRVLDAKTGADLLPPTKSVDDIYAQWGNEGRYIEVCSGPTGERPAIVIDVASQKTLFRSHETENESVLSCEYDEKTKDLAIAYFDSKSSKVTLEGWSLDTGKKWMTKVVSSEYIPDLFLYIDGPTHVVSLESAPYQASRTAKGRFDLHTGAALGAAPAPKATPKGKSTAPADPLSGIPVGSANSYADLGALEHLATNGKKLVHNFYSYSAGWTENGVLSQDKKWLALLEDADGQASGGGPAVLVIDAATLAVKHEIGLPSGYQWETMSFLDPTTLLVRLEWHYWVIDAETGAILASAEYDGTSGPGTYESVMLLAPTEVVIGSRLFDLRRDLPEGQPREIAAPFASLQVLETTTDTTGLSTYVYGDSVSFEMNDDGVVTFQRSTIPNWLVCIVKDEVFPFEACGAWATVAATR